MFPCEILVKVNSDVYRYYGFTGTIIMAFVGGYTVFLPGFWDIPTFFFSYTMIGVVPILFLCWKMVHKTEVSAFNICSFRASLLMCPL